VATWMTVGWLLIIGLSLGALYGLHRLGLWMEERGYIYYLHKKPKGSSAIGSLVAFQRAIEPRAEYVIQADQVNQEICEVGASGQGDPDEGSSKPVVSELSDSQLMRVRPSPPCLRRR
jgi:hypothetical protein